MATKLQTLVRHEGEARRERSTCGWRDRLIRDIADDDLFDPDQPG